LRQKFFVLDHTAEVLENYRRIQENELFNKVLFEEREKRAFLKKESRKMENLIDNYEQRFGDHKYLDGGNTLEFERLYPTQNKFLEEAVITRN
jgi:hypothetical protein